LAAYNSYRDVGAALAIFLPTKSAERLAAWLRH
jgi:hypothetical protein